ncbi:MAG: helix-turn-helix transcriptional regulator [Calothrix sp. C42_A2020_038]|nr:helix-turn-helix transcriptional regulator [Calothrix sp. C42_A2020_038]
MVIANNIRVQNITLSQRDYININSPKDLWEIILDGLEDSILIFTQYGELIHANSNARNIYYAVNSNSQNTQILFTSIKNLCQSLIEYDFDSEDNLIVSDEVVLNNLEVFRVRVRWLNVARYNLRYLLVTIENRYASVKNAAITEAKKYHLTQREAEIWCLYRAKSTYKQIAKQLYISVNTVKKHMKNIHAKRQAWETH